MENALTVIQTPIQSDEDAYLAKLVGYFDEAMEATQAAREKAERDRDYYDGKQFTAEEISELQRRGQPPIQLNLIASRVDYLLGIEKKARSDPKGYPRNPEDQQAADAFTDGMRYVVDEGDYASQRSAAYRNVFVEGYGGVEWAAQPTADGDVEIVPTHIPWDRILFDPHSAKPDFSDAAYMGQVLWLDFEDAVARAVENGADEADARQKLESTLSFSPLGQTFDDKPRASLWCDRRRRRVRIVNLWHRKGRAWKVCEFTKGGILWEMDGPYVMKRGQDREQYCPLVIESFKIDRDNNRYGPVRDLIDPQDEENKRRSKALHLLSVQGVIAETGAVESIEATRREMARPDFFVEVNPSARFEIVRHTDLAQGHVALAAQARDYIMTTGANNALQGRVSPDQSGRAIEAQQAGGMVELGDAMDSLRRFDRRSYKIVAAMMQQFWTNEKWVRVTDDELAPQYVGLNVAQWTDQLSGMTAGEKEWNQVLQQGGRPMLVQSPPMNPVAELDVDIIVADSPDTINNGIEAYQALTQLLGMAATTPPQWLRIAIEAHPGLAPRRKKQLLDMLEQGQGQPNPMQETAMEKAKADIEKTKAEGFKAMAQGEEIASRQHMSQAMPQPTPQPDPQMMAAQ